MVDAQNELVGFARERFGERTAVTERGEIEPWLTDWRGRFHGESAAILSPSSTDQVAAIVAKAAELKVALVPQGGNTSMVGGATPPADGSALLLSLRRMNRLRSLSAVDNLVVAEAGVILADLHRQTEAAGRRFPLSLGARGSCTIGGLIATNAGGTQVLRFGTMRSLVAGIEAVLPDGSVHEGLTGLRKDNRGYNLDQLLIGSEGTLGIVTAATLRLVPLPAQRSTAWVGLSSPEKALDLLRFLEQRQAFVEGFEIVPADCLQAVLDHIPGTRPPLGDTHDWNVLVEVTGVDPGDDLAAGVEALLAESLAEGIIEDAAIAANEAQAQAFWRIRDSISEAERSRGPLIAHDISVAVPDMPMFIVSAVAKVEAAFPGLEATGYGHLGDGNIHFHVRAAKRAAPDWYECEGAAVTRFVHDLVTAAGGSISAEHGIGQMKLAELERLGPPERLAAQRAIKAALDPAWMMNPGKLVRRVDREER